MNFYHSLRFKITLAFVALMLLSNSTALVLANRSVTERYATYVNQVDLQRATMAALFLSDSWGRWESAAEKSRGPLVLNDNQDSRSGMGRNMQPKGHEPIPFIVTDEEGYLLFDTEKQRGEEERIDHFQKGVPIEIDGERKAYVLAGSMIDSELSHMDKTMLRSINRTLILTNICSTLVILILGITLLGKILTPLQRIERAAADLGRGLYSVRSEIAGKDEIGRLGVHFDEMARSLEASEEWKRRIIADTAHELRTPVSLVLSRLEMIKDGIYPADEKQLNHLYGEVEQFSRLIREMQRLAGMEGGTVSLEKDKGAVIPFCLSQIHSFLPESRKKGVSLTWNDKRVDESFSPSLPDGEESRIQADWNRLEQVMKNLLSNALRHTPPEGTIRVRTELGERDVLICVEDSGPGIPEGERLRIFDRFYRLDSARNREQGGSGLGLAISKAIVEAHGGRISAGESDLGGAAFRVILPRKG
ncbi:MAG: ATP-binding protein [Spirochaetales bacterium]|nr:ATP-binding protein [Spirochaetales bacterium]